MLDCAFPRNIRVKQVWKKHIDDKEYMKKKDDYRITSSGNTREMFSHLDAKVEQKLSLKLPLPYSNLFLKLLLMSEIVYCNVDYNVPPAYDLLSN